ncbi:hypothetical protein JTB14_028740 [Gonioctena quinquepunctata]|nr:hypothetical protein JTB14_028740 [Gonioctena quinquepunctata]
MPTNRLKCVNGMFMHPGCLKYYSDIRKIDDKSIKCCNMKEMEDDKEVVDQDNSSETVPKITVSNIEIAHLKDLLKQKDLLIKNQQDLINSLKSQITLINQYATPYNGTNQKSLEAKTKTDKNEQIAGTTGQKQKKENLKEVYMNVKHPNE